MSLPPFASVADVEVRLGVPIDSLTGEERLRAEAALADASALIRAEAGKTWVADDGVTITAPDVVRVVAVQAAARVFRNPDGLQGEQIGDYGWQAAGPTTVYLTAEERRLIREAAAGGASSSIVTTRTPSAFEDAGDRYAWLRWLLS